METKLTLPCVLNLDGLEAAIRIIPELSLADLRFEFVLEQKGSRVTCENAAQLRGLAQSWLRRRAKDYGLNKPKKLKRA